MRTSPEAAAYAAEIGTRLAEIVLAQAEKWAEERAAAYGIPAEILQTDVESVDAFLWHGDGKDDAFLRDLVAELDEAFSEFKDSTRRSVP